MRNVAGVAEGVLPPACDDRGTGPPAFDSLCLVPESQPLPGQGAGSPCGLSRRNPGCRNSDFAVSGRGLLQIRLLGWAVAFTGSDALAHLASYRGCEIQRSKGI